MVGAIGGSEEMRESAAMRLSELKQGQKLPPVNNSEEAQESPEERALEANQVQKSAQVSQQEPDTSGFTA